MVDPVEAGLLRALAEDGEDRAAAAAYLDWLTERGETAEVYRRHLLRQLPVGLDLWTRYRCNRERGSRARMALRLFDQAPGAVCLVIAAAPPCSVPGVITHNQECQDVPALWQVRRHGKAEGLFKVSLPGDQPFPASCCARCLEGRAAAGDEGAAAQLAGQGSWEWLLLLRLVQLTPGHSHTVYAAGAEVDAFGQPPRLVVRLRAPGRKEADWEWQPGKGWRTKAGLTLPDKGCLPEVRDAIEHAARVANKG